MRFSYLRIVGSMFAWAPFGLVSLLAACGHESAGDPGNPNDGRVPPPDTSVSDASAPDKVQPPPTDHAGKECAPTGKGAAVATYDASTCGAVATVGASTCPVEKIAFAQCKACQNDGYVEVCLESNDTATRCAVTAIAPDAQFHPRSAGRAHCDPTHQILAMIPVDKSRDCPSDRHGASTDASWSRICAIAALANVKKVVPTFFE